MANRTVDALGFDRFQIAAIRRAYDNNKILYKKMDSIAAKIQALGVDYDSLEEQAKTWEAPARTISFQVLGVELSPREILAAHADPDAFFAAHPELHSPQAVPEEESAPAEEEVVEQEITDLEPVNELPSEDPFNV